MEKYYYIEELCPLSHYRGLFPVAYEKTEEGYRKKAMACRLVEDGTCRQPAECSAFRAASVLLEKEQEWKLCEELLGRNG